MAAVPMQEGVAPPGWEDTVQQMKHHGDISNPFALAWYMKNRGMHPHTDAASIARDVAAAQAELAGRQMPQRCVEAAKGYLYAQSQCLNGDPMIPERRW